MTYVPTRADNPRPRTVPISALHTYLVRFLPFKPSKRTFPTYLVLLFFFPHLLPALQKEQFSCLFARQPSPSSPAPPHPPPASEVSRVFKTYLHPNHLAPRGIHPAPLASASPVSPLRNPNPIRPSETAPETSKKPSLTYKPPSWEIRCLR